MAAPTSSWQESIEFFVNGQKRVLRNVNPRVTVLEYLRREEGLTGPKLSCGQGGCGACAVLVTKFDVAQNKFVNFSVNGCLKPVVALDGCNVTTTEGLGSSAAGFHPVQERIAGCNGSQCGFCTPGMVMTTYSLLKEKSGKPTLKDVENRFDGNICRCTGYRPILTAAHSFAVDCAACPNLDMEDIAKRFKPYDPTNDPQPPEALKTLASARPLRIVSSDSRNTHWYRATSIEQIKEIRAQHAGRNIRLVAGNTGVGVYGSEDIAEVDVFVDIKDIAELSVIAEESNGLRFGAAVTLSQLISTLEANTAKSPNTFSTIIAHLSRVANWHVRNAASWAGNLMMARCRGFPSDVATVLYGAGARLTAVALNGYESVTMDMRNFLESGGKGDSDLLLTALFVPFGGTNEYLETFRVAMRPVNAHALLNAAFRVVVDPTRRTVAEATLVYGVVNDKHAIRATRTEEFLIGKTFDRDTLHQAIAVVEGEISPKLKLEAQYVVATKPEGKEPLRRNLVGVFLYKFFRRMRRRLVDQADNSAAAIADDASLSFELSPPPSSGRLEYEVAADRAAFPKMESVLQASGEAVYTDDMPAPKNVLYGALVLTDRAAATIVGVDASAALAADGVVAFVTASDIPNGGMNDIGFVPCEEEVFATMRSPCVGTPVGLVVAQSQREADAAARLVRVDYGDNYEPPVLSIDDAITHKSFIDPSMGGRAVVQSGDVDTVFSQAASRGLRVLEGVVRVGSQSHFYMEKQAAFAMPTEGGGVWVHVGNQAPNYTRAKLAAVLGLPGNRVTVESRRTGGAFGGKLTRQLATAAATCVAARKLNRPIKTALNIRADMQHVGGRHDMVVIYKVAFDATGRLVAIDYKTYANAGCSADFSPMLISEYNENLDAVYYCPNFRAEVIACRTHLPSRTAVRSFGHVQAAYASESVIEAVAAAVGRTPEEVREMNYYTVRTCVHPSGQFLGDGYNGDKLFAELKQKAEFDRRRRDIDAFNAAHKWRKRGICLVGSKYGLNQMASVGTSALVNINNSDGTVVVYHGGTEMGQGIHTKVAQTVAMTLGCPLECVRVGDTNTDVIPNMMFTGGSTGSECNAEAARLACVKILERLAPIRAELWANSKEGKEPTWQALIGAAAAKHVLLSATANFIPHGRRDDPVAGKPWKFHDADYFAFGAGCAEVEVDTLTGELSVLRVDMLYDNGRSLNPVIDLGQAEGGFIMGLGYYLREEVLESPTDGRNRSNDTWEYKPPLAVDIPRVFNIEFVKNSTFPAGVMGQKGVGEPPMVLAYAVAGAVRTVVNTVRRERGLPYLELDAPLTVDRVQTACHPSLKDLDL